MIQRQSVGHGSRCHDRWRGDGGFAEIQRPPFPRGFEILETLKCVVIAGFQFDDVAPLFQRHHLADFGMAVRRHPDDADLRRVAEYPRRYSRCFAG